MAKLQELQSSPHPPPHTHTHPPIPPPKKEKKQNNSRRFAVRIIGRRRDQQFVARPAKADRDDGALVPEDVAWVNRPWQRVAPAIATVCRQHSALNLGTTAAHGRDDVNAEKGPQNRPGKLGLLRLNVSRLVALHALQDGLCVEAVRVPDEDRGLRGVGRSRGNLARSHQLLLWVDAEAGR